MSKGQTLKVADVKGQASTFDSLIDQTMKVERVTCRTLIKGEGLDYQNLKGERLTCQWFKA